MPWPRITSEILEAYERYRIAEEEPRLAEAVLNSLAAKEGFRNIDDVAAAIIEQI